MGFRRCATRLPRYTADLYGIAMQAERITATSSGMTGIMLAMEMLVDAGDNVVIVGPVWPNAQATVEIMAGEPRTAPLRFGNEGWTFDLDRLMACCDDRTRAVFVNSPGNPTGWMMPESDQRALLDFCRTRGIWIIADEVYARIVYDRRVAPSFLSVAEPEDRLIVINSFSKSWAMTGWRLGWDYAPELLRRVHRESDRVQHQRHAGFPAARGGDRGRGRRGGDRVHGRPVPHGPRGHRPLPRGTLPRVRYRAPDAAFYAFFAIDGMDNSLDFAKRLVHETGVGLAPGTAFGPDGEGWLRLCFARAPETLEQAVERLAPSLA